MRIPWISIPVPTAIRLSQRLIRITRSIPGIQDFVSTFAAAVTSLENRQTFWMSARTETSVAVGSVKESMAALEEVLRSIGFTILAIGRGRKSFEVYGKYFPKGYGKAIGLSVENALGIATGILGTMANEAMPRILAHREPLTTACAGVEAARAARQGAINAQAEARALLHEEKLVWRKAYANFYFVLLDRFFDRRSFVESLFRDIERNTEGEDEGEEQGVEGDESNASDVVTQVTPAGNITK